MDHILLIRIELTSPPPLENPQETCCLPSTAYSGGRCFIAQVTKTGHVEDLRVEDGKTLVEDECVCHGIIGDTLHQSVGC